MCTVHLLSSTHRYMATDRKLNIKHEEKDTYCTQVHSMVAIFIVSTRRQKILMRGIMCMLCANVQWKCGAYFLKAEPFSRGSLSPWSHLVSPFNLNLKPDCHPPTCISCYYLQARASQHKGAAKKPRSARISNTSTHFLLK